MASTESHLTGSSSGDRRSSDEIRRDIQRQRDELDVTAEVLQRKLAPRELAEQLWHDMRTRVGGSAGDVVDMVKRHPLPLGLIGAGIAWWIYESSSRRGSSFGNGDYDEDDELGVGSMSTGSYRSRSSDASSSGYSYESGYQTGEEEGSEGWRQRSMRAAARSTERLRSSASSARHGFSEAVDRNPLALGAACFSLGMLAGIAVPTTGLEERTMGGTSARVSRKARDAAREAAVRAAEKGARAAQSAADRLREEVNRPSSQYRGTPESVVQEPRRDTGPFGGSSSWGSGGGTAGTPSA